MSAPGPEWTAALKVWVDRYRAAMAACRDLEAQLDRYIDAFTAMLDLLTDDQLAQLHERLSTLPDRRRTD